MPETLQQFKERIRKLRDQVEKGEIEIAQIDGATTALSKKILLAAYDDILRDDNTELDKILQNGGHYFQRDLASKGEVDNPARSYGITRDAQGNYKVFIEPKSKLPDNTPRDANFPGGSFKVCKVAYRIDMDPFIPCAALVTHIDEQAPDASQSKYDNAMETRRNNDMAKISPEFFGEMSTITERRGSVTKIHSYMEHAEYDLFFILNSAISNPQYNGYPELDRTLVQCGSETVETWKLDILWQLVQAINRMHTGNPDKDKRYCHRDLKIENIMCQYDPISKRFAVKVIDFGLAKTLGYDQNDVAGTHEYVPPEPYILATAHLGKSQLAILENMLASYTKEARDYGSPDPICIGLEKAIEMVKTAEAAKILSGATANHGEHDIWSLGILFGDILKWPLKNMQHDSGLHLLIQTMLTVDPNKRPNSQQLVDLAKSIPEFIGVTELAPIASVPSTPKEFKDTAILQNALTSFLNSSDDWHDKLIDYFDCFSIAKQSHGENKTFMDVILVGILDLHAIATSTEKINKQPEQLKEIIAQLELLKQQEWYKRTATTIKQKRDGSEEEVTHEDAWVQKHEKRLAVNLVMELTKITLAILEPNINKAEVTKQLKKLIKIAKRDAELIESHKLVPHAYRFNKGA